MSNVIKAPFTKTDHSRKKLIEIKNYFLKQHDLSATVDMSEHTYAQMTIEQAEREAQFIKQEAEHYYESVKQQLFQERENWNIEKQQLIDMAKEEGYKSGFAQGKEEALNHYRELIHEAQRVVEAANEQFYKQVEAADETILLIGLKVAERIIGEKFAENDVHFLSLVKRAIKEVRDQSEVKIYVHPLYYEMVVQQKDELRSIFNQEVDMFIYPDEQLEENGCMIETPFGRIDASVDTQLQKIKEKLLERLGEE
ncbi:flagellar assembly protein FliH [Anoxybacillus caldiproteolyticus]|uniref:Flagellar assembly protein FliH n=1 Tax=Thermaerobacillus caldiproteolyticus TaxID=247480 RepID=A0A7V9Z4M9_9BACL|nr:flagellar assembly protein FliH [Anoxybacillus caldiproteolyticus]